MERDEILKLWRHFEILGADAVVRFAHALEAAERKRCAAEMAAWRERFPHHAYRPQDGCVALLA